jgi:hypothetical protein
MELPSSEGSVEKFHHLASWRQWLSALSQQRAQFPLELGSGGFDKSYWPESRKEILQ